MSDPLRVVILGAGGLGGYVGAILTRAGCHVTHVARGGHLDVLRERGLRVSDGAGDSLESVHVCEDGSDLADIDVAFLAVKTYALAGIANQSVALAKGGAVIVPLLNGVEAREQLEYAGVPPAHIAPGVAYLTALLTEPGHVTRVGTHGRVVIGAQSEAPGAPLSRLGPGFEQAGVTLDFTTDPALESWRKMMVVCSVTAACALSGAPVGNVRQRPSGQRVLSEAVSEVGRVARASGVAITEEHETNARTVLDGFPEDFYPSLIHDLKRGRPTEIDALNGAVSRIGNTLGVSTPVHDAATCAVEIWQEGRRER